MDGIQLIGKDFIHIALLDWRESNVWRKMLGRKGYVFHKPKNDKKNENE